MTASARWLCASCAALLGSLTWPAPAQAERESSPTIHISRAAEPPRLEWFVHTPNGAAHDRGTIVTDFLQQQPGDGTPVSESTAAFLSYDDAYLYVVFVCQDDRTAVRANVARREDIDSDDGVGVYLDTFHDRERAYVFMVNPLGVQLDGIETEGQSGDYTFDAVWQSEGHLTPDGYVVRLAIPFRSLRFTPQSEQTWGIALERKIRRKNETAYWPQITKRVHGFVPQFGTITGLRDISAGRNVQVQPYGVMARARVLDKDTVAFGTASDARLGLDAKLVVRDALALDTTVNPDFSQVESDDPQVTVNQRFEVFFPEKRPFFLENAAFFQTPINLFFSRRIVDPGVGTRLTGKLGHWALGAIAINDRQDGRVATGDRLAGRQSGIGAFRVQREIGRGSTVGLLVTDREFAGSFARSFALDNRWRLNRTWIATAQLVRSDTQAPDGTHKAGAGAFAQIERKGRQLEYKGRYLGFTPDFDAPLGFVHRVGFHQTEQKWRYTWRPKRRPIVSFGPEVEALFNWERTGHLQDRNLAAAFEVELVRQTTFEVSHAETFERFAGLNFEPRSTALSVATKWKKWLALNGDYAFGTAVNHDPAPTLAPFLGSAKDAEFGLTLRPTPRIRVGETYLVSRLESQAASIFTERRLRTKLTYQVTRYLSVRAIVDNETVAVNRALAEGDDERKWSGDFLLTYLVNPGTALYIGYIDQFENIDILPGSTPGLRRIGRPATSVGRQVFAKVSYLLRF
jgi:uncharacterized protein DUF5916